MNYRAVLFLAVMCLAISQLAHAQTEPPPIDDPGDPGNEPPPPEACPPVFDRAIDMVENFLTNPDLADARSIVGVENISMNDVQVLKDEDDGFTCEGLNQQYDDIEDAKIRYHFTFFKTPTRYIIVQMPRQPSDPNEVFMGSQRISFYSHGLDRIEGFSGR